MVDVDLDQEVQTMCPVYTGSTIDRLAHWCRDDRLQQEESVLKALAHAREVLHVLPESLQPEDPVEVQAGALATLICEVQAHLSQSAQCAD
jgi:hypothetical protein